MVLGKGNGMPQAIFWEPGSGKYVVELMDKLEDKGGRFGIVMPVSSLYDSSSDEERHSP